MINEFDLKFAIITLRGKRSIDGQPRSFLFLFSEKKIEVKSTVGAGDAFTAATVMGWLNQNPMDQIIQKATDLATFVCSHLEAIPQNKKSKYNENKAYHSVFSWNTFVELSKKELPDLQNVILIITDDQGYGDLGFHKNPNIITPAIDAFAKKSIRFNNFHVSPFVLPPDLA